MSQVLNLTPFAACCLPSLSRDDHELTMLVVQGRFVLPPPGSVRREPPTPAVDQGEVGLDDVYLGDPATSSLQIEGQSAYTRPGTDVYLRGHAWAPGERPVARSLVDLRVGSRRRTAVVFGERVWGPGLAGGGLRPGRPEPFVSVPLCYERCLGGTLAAPSRSEAAVSDHNPVGRGLHAASHAVGERLPNFEDPERLIERHGDWPAPHGFGPIARHWLPRRSWAGTYDEPWLARRVPLWPSDLDERFFSAAAPGLCITPHLVGGESVQVSGMSPAGVYTFSLPAVALQARFERAGGSIRRRLVLDAIDIDTHAGVLTLTWRTHVAANSLSVAAIVLRALASWETAA